MLIATTPQGRKQWIVERLGKGADSPSSLMAVLAAPEDRTALLRIIGPCKWELHWIGTCEEAIEVVGYLLDSGNRSGIGLVGRSPWTAADARVRLLAGRPGGRPRARAPAPHRSAERGYLSERFRNVPELGPLT